MATKRKSAPIIPLKSARGRTNIIDAVLAGKPVKSRPRGIIQPPTVADRLKAVLGRRQMNARQLAEAAVAAGEKFDSKNLVALVASALVQSTARINGRDGEPLRDRNGYIVKVHVFTSSKKGLYRVASPEDMHKEALAILDTVEEPPKALARQSEKPREAGQKRFFNRAKSEPSWPHRVEIRGQPDIMANEIAVSRPTLVHYCRQWIERDDWDLSSWLRHHKRTEESPAVVLSSATNGRGDGIRDMLLETIRTELRTILRGDSLDLKAMLREEMRSMLCEMLTEGKL